MGVCGLFAAAAKAEAATFWLDLHSGEEVAEARLIDDLADSDVIYVGETHTISRHHETQARLLEALAVRGVPLVLAMEQIEAHNQPVVDRYNRGELNFDGLAAELDWAKQWKNFGQYRALCDLAQKRGVPLAALNAPAEVIRAIGRGGLESLPPDQRARLPKEIVTDDPAYEKLMNLLLSVHMTMDPAKLRPVFEAQVSRDEMMAERVAAAIKGGSEKRTVFVVCGSGHIRYGLGTPDRVRRRVPQATERIVLITESGELRLTPEEEAMRRDITVSHADLRSLGRPLADYLQVLPRSTKGQ